MLRRSSFLLILPLIYLFQNCSSFSQSETKFNYKTLYERKFEQGTGGSIPLTINSGESTNGTISRKGDFLIYSSNEEGSYSFYYKPLDSVRSYPFLLSASNQRESVISPNGKYIAFTDDELDPDGDIVLVPANMKSIRNSKDAVEAAEKNANRRKFLTNHEVNRVRSIDANPAFSPDSKTIVFSSDRTSVAGDPFGPGLGAPQNIWIMSVSNPKNSRQITTNGGVMPSFSPDGSKIIYISYRDPAGNGDIYEVDVQTGEERQITETSFLETFPEYSQDGLSILYTVVEEDTNNNGYLDRKDRGTIRTLSLPERAAVAVTKTNESSYIKPVARPLSPENQNIVSTHTVPFMSGSLVYSESDSQNINLHLMPAEGPVPPRETIFEQWDLAEQLLSKANTPEDRFNYFIGLDAVQRFHRDDPLFPVFYAKALVYRVIYSSKWNINAEESKEKLKELIESGSPAGSVLYAGYLNYSPLSKELKSISGLPAIPQQWAPGAGETASAYFTRVVSNESFAAEYTALTPSELAAEVGEHPFWSQQPEKNKQEEIERLSTIAANRSPFILDYFTLENAEAHATEALVEDSIELGKQVIISRPAYPQRSQVLLRVARWKSQQDLSPELLFLVDPKNNTLKSEYSAESEKYLRENPDEQVSIEANLLGWEILYSKLGQRLVTQFDQLKSQYAKGPVQSLFAAAELKYFLEQDNLEKASIALGELEKSVQSTKNPLWQYYALRYSALLAEKQKDSAGAYARYSESIPLYRKEYKDPMFAENYQRTLEYFRSRGLTLKSAGKYKEAWKQYKPMIETSLKRSQREDLTTAEEQTLLSVAIESANIALATRNNKNQKKLNKEILNFYDKKHSLAQASLNTPVIFARAYLLTQWGALEHEEYAKKKISSGEKKSVLKKFKEAEGDYHWSFFAAPEFFDSYVMLSWMYQYIDTQKEKIVNERKREKDKDKFEHLYRKYFPERLYEKNVQLYQQAISRFSGKVSPAIISSFHLNMGNNYYLLNNFAKAEEHYNYVFELASTNKYSFENQTQEAIFYFNYGRSMYFTSKYRKSNSALEKSLSIYESKVTSKSSKKKRKSVQEKTEQIRRYIANNTALIGDTDSAIEIYNQILAEQKRLGIKRDQSYIYMQLARHYLTNKDYDQTFKALSGAESALKREPEIKAPKFYIRIRFLGTEQPWTWLLGTVFKMHYDTVYNGSNHIAFTIPTLQRYEYLYSMRAQIYSQRGLFPQEEKSLKSLIKKAEKDKSLHGKETLNNAYMRLATNYYHRGLYKSSRERLEESLELAEKRKDLVTQQRAKKSLLYIQAKETKSISNHADRLKRLSKNIKELDSSIKEYTKLALETAEEAQKAKNKDLKLSSAERSAVRKQAAKETFSLYLFRAGFLAEKAQLTQEQELAKNTPASFTEFETQHKTLYENYLTPLQLYSGDMPNPGLSEYKKTPAPEEEKETFTYLDTKDNRLKITRDINSGTIYSMMGIQERSINQFNSAEKRSYEVQITLLQAVSLAKLASQKEEITAEEQKRITDVWNEFSQRPSLISFYPDTYHDLTDVLVLDFVKKKQYDRAIQISDRSIQLLATSSFSEKMAEYSGPGSEEIQRILYLVRLDEELNRRRELISINRGDTTEIEAEIAALRQEKATLVNTLNKNAETKTVSLVFFSSQENRLPANKSYLYSRKLSNENWLVIYPQEQQDPETEKVSRQTSHTYLKSGNWKKLSKILTDENIHIAFVPEETTPADWKQISSDSQVHMLLQEYNFYSRNNSISLGRVAQYAPKKFLSEKGSGEKQYKTYETVSAADSTEFSDLRSFSIYDIEVSREGSFPIIDATNLKVEDVFSQETSPSLTLISEASTGEARGRYYHLAGVNLLLAAAGSSKTVFLDGTRSKKQQLIENIFAGVKNVKAVYSGNPALFQIDEENWEETKTNLLKKEKAFYLAAAKKQYQAGAIDDAGQIVARIENIDKSLSDVEDKENTELLKANLFYASGKTGRAEKIYQTLLSESTEKTSEKIINDYLATLLRYTDDQTAAQKWQDISGGSELSTSSRNYLQMTYFDSVLNRGDLQAFSGNPPEFLGDSLLSENPQSRLKQIGTVSFPGSRRKALLTAREYSWLSSLPQETNYWETRNLATMNQKILNGERFDASEEEVNDYEGFLFALQEGKTDEALSAFDSAFPKDSVTNNVQEDAYILSMIQAISNKELLLNKDKIASRIKSFATAQIKTTTSKERLNWYRSLSQLSLNPGYLTKINQFYNPQSASASIASWNLIIASIASEHPESYTGTPVNSPYTVDDDSYRILSYLANNRPAPKTTEELGLSLRYSLNRKNPSEALAMYLTYDRNLSLDSLTPGVQGVLAIDNGYYFWSYFGKNPVFTKIDKELPVFYSGKKPSAKGETWYYPEKNRSELLLDEVFVPGRMWSAGESAIGPKPPIQWTSTSRETEFSSLARIHLANPSKEGNIYLTSLPAASSRQLEIVTAPVDITQTFVSDEKTSFSILYTDPEIKSVYLLFIDKFFENLSKSNAPLPQVYLKTQNQLKEEIPNPNDLGKILLLAH